MRPQPPGTPRAGAASRWIALISLYHRRGATVVSHWWLRGMTDVDADLWSALCQPPVLFTPKHVTRRDPRGQWASSTSGGGEAHVRRRNKGRLMHHSLFLDPGGSNLTFCLLFRHGENGSGDMLTVSCPPRHHPHTPQHHGSMHLVQRRYASLAGSIYI